MKIAIFCKNEDAVLNGTAKELTEALSERGIEVISLDGDYDVLAVVGGDGTVLKAVGTLKNPNVPVFSINAGTVGFLTSAERSDIPEIAKLLADGEYTVSERSALEITTDNDSYFALNDAVIERDKCSIGNSVISKLRLSIDSKIVYDLRADGIIISTPTGSTAYSLSAGGVILTPNLNAFIATPICSHALSTRPIVFSDTNEARIDVLENSCPCVLCIDGKAVETLNQGQSAIVAKSKKTLKFIDFKMNFFENIKKKLGD